MPNSHYNLEEQLRQDRRIGNAQRRRRRIRRLFPLLLLFLLLAAAVWLLLPGDETEETEPSSEAPVTGSSAATLSFVGDINLDKTMMERFRTETGYDFTALLHRIVPRLAPADLTVGNLEGNVSDELSDHSYPPALLQALYAAGFDILQTGNSYTIQNGIMGLNATKQAIQTAGMDPLGSWTSQEDREENGVLIREVNGIRFAFLCFTKGLNNLRLPAGAEYCVNLLYTDYDTTYSRIARAAIEKAVEEARMKSPDVIIALVHWGSEYDQQIAESQKEIAELLFNGGVHLVIGSHSHYVGPMELRSKEITSSGGSFIAYSLGDFVSLADSSTARNGCILSFTVTKDSSGCRISDLNYVPTYSTAPSEELEITDYEVLDTLGAISSYKQGFYDRVSDPLYAQLLSGLEKIKEQTGMPDSLAEK